LSATRFCAIVVAAGRGVRFGRPKQLVDVAGKPLVAWSLATFDAIEGIEHLVIATESEHLETMAELARVHAPRLHARVVAGGATRRESTANALAAVPAACDGVFVHDGARPLVARDDVRAGMAAIGPGVGALLAIPVVDTIKVVPPGSNVVTKTLERAELWAAQTPQFAMTDDLRRAHALGASDGFEATDDAVLLERAGCRVVVVPATAENFKVTLRGDRELAEAIIRDRLASARTAVS
jgi:2-C-methyl-D-erythritol 4-phosphate cytidylyltransferase